MAILNLNENNVIKVQYAKRCLICCEAIEYFDNPYEVPNYPVVCDNCRKAVMKVRAETDKECF